MVNFPSEQQLRSMTVPQIKKHVREFNEHYAIKGYSKLTKDQLISAVLTAQMRVSKGKPTGEFEMPEKKPRKKPEKKPEPEPKKTKKKLVIKDAPKEGDWNEAGNEIYIGGKFIPVFGAFRTGTGGMATSLTEGKRISEQQSKDFTRQYEGKKLSVDKVRDLFKNATTNVKGNIEKQIKKVEKSKEFEKFFPYIGLYRVNPSKEGAVELSPTGKSIQAVFVSGVENTKPLADIKSIDIDFSSRKQVIPPDKSAKPEPKKKEPETLQKLRATLIRHISDGEVSGKERNDFYARSEKLKTKKDNTPADRAIDAMRMRITNLLNKSKRKPAGFDKAIEDADLSPFPE